MKKLVRHIVQSPGVISCDVIAVNLGLFLSLCVRWGALASPRQNLLACLHVAPFAAFAAVTLFYVSDLYSQWWRRTGTEIIYAVISSVCILSLVTMAVSFWARQFAFPRTVMIAATGFQILLLASARLGLRRAYLFFEGRRRALVIAENGTSARTLVDKLLHVDTNWFAVSGWLIGEEIEELETRVLDFDVILITPGVAHKAELIRRCARIKKDVLLVPDVFELSLFGAKAIELGDVLTFLVRPPRLTPGQRLVKRAVDFAGALILIAVSAPLLVLVTVLIRLTSRGPVLFRQDRVGRQGREYVIYKFRTMICDAESETGPVLASKNDPRVTPVGKFLRSSRLDELPQLFNVLRGEMSLVGPRPERAFFVSQFRESVPGYDFRLAVKPGITGLAQVYGTYSSSVARKLRFDLMYIYDYSLLLDAKILLKTIGVVFEKAKSEGVHVVEPANRAEEREEIAVGD